MEKRKTVLITGSSRGIGAELAKEFAKNNYNVVINYFHSKEKALALLEEITNFGCNAIAVYADVRNSQDVEDMINTAIKTFGRIDVLINNAGVALCKLFIDCNEEDFDYVMNTNFKSYFHVVKRVLPIMLHNGYGRIINISSVWGQEGGALETIYSASKGAIIAFTKALAKEYALSGVTVNTIAPGVVDTDMISIYSDEIKEMVTKMIAIEKIALPSDITPTAIFLASPAADYITGQVIPVNGGFYT